MKRWTVAGAALLAPTTLFHLLEHKPSPRGRASFFYYDAELRAETYPSDKYELQLQYSRKLRCERCPSSELRTKNHHDVAILDRGWQRP